MNMKTDLTKILSVSGRHGLHRYIAQARNGAVVESLADKSRTLFDANYKITTLADISIYTKTGEVKLEDVLKKLNEVLGDKELTSKSSPDEIKSTFAEAVPDYDGDRFYFSHMKKILDWYGDIKNYASFDFMTDEERQKEKDGDAAGKTEEKTGE